MIVSLRQTLNCCCQSCRRKHTGWVHWKPENNSIDAYFEILTFFHENFVKIWHCLKNDSIKMTREPQIANKLSMSVVKLQLGWTRVKNYLNSVAQRLITSPVFFSSSDCRRSDCRMAPSSMSSLSRCSRKSYGVTALRSHFSFDNISSSISWKKGN